MTRLAVALLVLFTASTVVKAEPFKLPSISECDTDVSKIIGMVQEKYNELPFVIGETMVQSLNGIWMPAELIMFVGPDTGSFSIIVKEKASDSGCLYLAGKGISPVQ